MDQIFPTGLSTVHTSFTRTWGGKENSGNSEGGEGGAPWDHHIITSSPSGDSFRFTSRFHSETWLAGGFKHFLLSSLFGEMIQFYKYFSDGLKPPTRWGIMIFWSSDFARNIWAGGGFCALPARTKSWVVLEKKSAKKTTTGNFWSLGLGILATKAQDSSGSNKGFFLRDSLLNMM